MADSNDMPTTTRELRSTVTDDGTITLAIGDADVRRPGSDEVVVRIGAAPINPSDLGLMFAGADVDSVRAAEGSDGPGASATVSQGLGALAGRFGTAMPAGNEGGGTVVGAGDSPEAQAMVGKVVGFTSGDSYAEFRTMHRTQCLVMPDGVTPEEAAAPFVNPMTALGMVETMRLEGHTALVHTVGASNLGQMLVKICLADDIGLVNIVRRPEQAELVRGLGAQHVVDSSAESFRDDLADALRATGATIAFDAIGGGEMAGTLLAAMEQVANEGAEYNRYGSGKSTQVYVYGRLDTSPMVVHQRMGFAWSIGGWLLPPFLARIGEDETQRLRDRVAAEITTTFASDYGMRLSLDEAVDPEHVRRYMKMATGEKALLVPDA